MRLCEWKGISAILRFCFERENESDSRPQPPQNIFSERVFLDRLLRHSTFSSCFPFSPRFSFDSTAPTRQRYNTARSRDTKSPEYIFSLPHNSENVHDYIEGGEMRGEGWVYNTCTLGIGLDTEKRSFGVVCSSLSPSCSLSADRYFQYMEMMAEIKEEVSEGFKNCYCVRNAFKDAW